MKMQDQARRRRAELIQNTTPQTPRREFNAFVYGSLAVIVVVCLVIGVLP